MNIEYITSLPMHTNLLIALIVVFPLFTYWIGIMRGTSKGLRIERDRARNIMTLVNITSTQLNKIVHETEKTLDKIQHKEISKVEAERLIALGRTNITNLNKDLHNARNIMSPMEHVFVEDILRRMTNAYNDMENEQIQGLI